MSIRSLMNEYLKITEMYENKSFEFGAQYSCATLST